MFEANVTNYAFTTNTVPSRLFEADDRRFLVLQHDGTHVQDVPYLSSLRSAMKEGAEDFFLFLKNRKIKTFVLGEVPPQSSRARDGVGHKFARQTERPRDGLGRSRGCRR